MVAWVAVTSDFIKSVLKWPEDTEILAARADQRLGSVELLIEQEDLPPDCTRAEARYVQWPNGSWEFTNWRKLKGLTPEQLAELDRFLDLLTRGNGWKAS